MEGWGHYQWKGRKRKQGTKGRGGNGCKQKSMQKGREGGEVVAVEEEVAEGWRCEEKRLEVKCN